MQIKWGDKNWKDLRNIKFWDECYGWIHENNMLLFLFSVCLNEWFAILNYLKVERRK